MPEQSMTAAGLSKNYFLVLNVGGVLDGIWPNFSLPLGVFQNVLEGFQDRFIIAIGASMKRILLGCSISVVWGFPGTLNCASKYLDESSPLC